MLLHSKIKMDKKEMKQKRQIREICKYFFIAGKNDLPDREFNQKFKDVYDLFITYNLN